MPTNLGPNDPADPYAHCTAQHLHDLLAGHELEQTPGDTVGYSNLGAGLRAHALSLRAGMDYESLVRARILAPLGMDSTVIVVPPALASWMAQRHVVNLDPVTDWYLGVLAGAGRLRSCVSDLLVFLEMIMDHEGSPLVPAAALLVAPRDQRGPGSGMVANRWGHSPGAWRLDCRLPVACQLRRPTATKRRCPQQFCGGCGRPWQPFARHALGDVVVSPRSDGGSGLLRTPRGSLQAEAADHHGCDRLRWPVVRAAYGAGIDSGVFSFRMAFFL